MSGFVSAAGKRLTARRLVIVVGLSVLACGLVAFLAPLVGSNNDHYELLSPAAYAGDSIDHQVVVRRLVRVLASLVAGGALAGAGCGLQALLRNPLAEPFTLGISGGSSLAAVIAIRLGAERVLGHGAIGIAALLGALATLLLVWRLAEIGRQLPPATLVLAGVAIAMFSSAAAVLVQYTSDFADVEHMLAWMMGGLETVRLVWVAWGAIPILAGLGVLVWYARELNALAAGPDVAASLGVAVTRTQRVVFIVTSVLVGCAIAIVGPIGFVGLAVPHALRAVLGPDHRALLPASIFGGAAVLAVCDTLARTVIPLNHLPTGALTALLGVPFFFAILVAHKRRAALWGRA